jgi:hypothetical protein
MNELIQILEEKPYLYEQFIEFYTQNIYLGLKKKFENEREN